MGNATIDATGAQPVIVPPHLQPCGKAAIEYAALGWHVFPAPLGQKKSHKAAEHSGGREWGATTDTAEIIRDFARWQRANVGIVTGPKSGFFVVECDTPKGHAHDGVANMAALIEEHGRWDETPEALSPTGSWHILFEWPEGARIQNSQGLIAPGIDVRGDGGMIIGVPSRREGYDQTYRWKNPPGLFKLTKCPAWLLDKIQGGQKGKSGPRIDTGGYANKAEKFAEAWKDAGTDGSKHKGVVTLTSMLAARIPDKGIVQFLAEQACPVHDANFYNSVETAFKFAPEGEADARPRTPAVDLLEYRITHAIEAVTGTKPAINTSVLSNMIEGAFWSGAKSRLFLLNEDETLVQFVIGDAWTFLCRRFGTPVDVDAMVADAVKGLAAKEVKKAADEARTAITKAMVGPIIDHLKYENQRDSVEWAVDMFAKRSRLELRQDMARIVLTHRALAEGAEPDPKCVADYKEHFPLLDETLAYIIAGRFALDRKKSYLWLLATSDWGKGFLMGALTNLGLVVQMSVKEIEAVFEGKPAGRRPEDFKRAMILAVDEFKAVKSELKQLQSEIQLAPKFQLTARVEIFTKLFLSAESVGSLVTENGVEDQFANRMSLLTGSGTLNGRAVYDRDQPRYFRSVQAYIARTLNALITEYQGLGREEAERKADQYLNGFIGKHGLGEHFQRLSESYPQIAAEAAAWAVACGRVTPWEGHAYLQHASKVLEDFLALHYTQSEIGTLRRRKMEIMAAMSVDGRGNASHKIAGVSVKAVKMTAPPIGRRT